MRSARQYLSHSHSLRYLDATLPLTTIIIAIGSPRGEQTDDDDGDDDGDDGDDDDDDDGEEDYGDYNQR